MADEDKKFVKLSVSITDGDKVLMLAEKDINAQLLDMVEGEFQFGHITSQMSSTMLRKYFAEKRKNNG